MSNPKKRKFENETYQPPPQQQQTRQFALLSQPLVVSREHQLPENIQQFIPESLLFTQLQEFEHKLDSVLSEKKQRMRTLLTDAPVHKRTLRIFVNHDRPAQNPFLVNLRIQGHFFDETGTLVTNSIKDKFTEFVKKIYIEFDKAYFPDTPPIEWEHYPGFQETEGFLVTRTMKQPQVPPTEPPKAKIVIQLRYDPQVFIPSFPLYQLLSYPYTPSPSDKIPTKTLKAVLNGIWEYIKAKNLQDPLDRKMINNDKVMKEIFGCDKMAFTDIVTKVKEHLILPEPIEIDYVIRLDEVKPFEQYYYDIEVDTTSVDLLLDKPAKEIQVINEQIAKAVANIKNHKKKRDFMLAFAQDPVHFIQELINSQTRELIIMNNQQELEEQRYAHYYKKPWVNEAISRYLTKKQAQSTQNPFQRTHFQ